MGLLTANCSLSWPWGSLQSTPFSLPEFLDLFLFVVVFADHSKVNQGSGLFGQCPRSEVSRAFWFRSPKVRNNRQYCMHCSPHKLRQYRAHPDNTRNHLPHKRRVWCNRCNRCMSDRFERPRDMSQTLDNRRKRSRGCSDRDRCNRCSHCKERRCRGRRGSEPRCQMVRQCLLGVIIRTFLAVTESVGDSMLVLNGRVILVQASERC